MLIRCSSPCKAENVWCVVHREEPLPMVEFRDLRTSRPEWRLSKSYRLDAPPSARTLVISISMLESYILSLKKCAKPSWHERGTAVWMYTSRYAENDEQMKETITSIGGGNIKARKGKSEAKELIDDCHQKLLRVGDSSGSSKSIFEVSRTTGLL